jgi:hypothetical protein
MKTITTSEYNEERYCNVCKKTCGHYTHQHDDWLELTGTDKYKQSDMKIEIEEYEIK